MLSTVLFSLLNAQQGASLPQFAFNYAVASWERISGARELVSTSHLSAHLRPYLRSTECRVWEQARESHVMAHVFKRFALIWSRLPSCFIFSQTLSSFPYFLLFSLLIAALISDACTPIPSHIFIYFRRGRF